MREDVGRKETYKARGAVCVAICLFFVGILAAGSWRGAQGRDLFAAIAGLQTVAISLAGVTYFSSTIAEEKEEQTLGLLRMTGLSPLSVVLGKSTSRLCGVLLLLASQFPFTVLAVTFGGISLGQVLAANCALAAYAFLLCNVALLGSVLMREVAGAAAFTAVIGGVHLGAGPLLGVISAQWPRWQYSAALDVARQPLWDATVISRLNQILATGFQGGPFSGQVMGNLVAGAVFFLLAWLAFGHFCEGAAAGAPASGEDSRSSVRSWLRRPPRPTGNALVWKDLHFMCGGKLGMIVRGAVYGPCLLAALAEWIIRPDWDTGNRGWAYSLVPLLYSLDVGSMAARIFRREIRDHTLSTLAILPCGIREIAVAKARGFLIAAAPGALAVAVVTYFYLTPWDEVEPSMLAVVAVWANIPALAYLAALFSLRMKYGALPVSYLLTAYLFGTLSIFAALNRFAVFFGPCLVSALCAVYFHREISARLEAIASRD